MKIKALLMAVTAAAALTATAAQADNDPRHDRWQQHYRSAHDGWRHDYWQDRGHGRGHDNDWRRDYWEGRYAQTHRGEDWRGHDDWHWYGNGGWHVDHDRYWQPGWRFGYWAPRDRFFVTLRSYGYYRWDGDPFWWHGRYVIRTYDRWGNLIFVEMNPYTGGFIGVVRF